MFKAMRLGRIETILGVAFLLTIFWGLWVKWSEDWKREKILNGYRETISTFVASDDFEQGIDLINKWRLSLPDEHAFLDTLEVSLINSNKMRVTELIEEKKLREAATMARRLVKKYPEDTALAEFYKEITEKIFYESLSDQQKEVYDFYSAYIAALARKDVDKILEAWHPSIRITGAKLMLKGLLISTKDHESIKIIQIDMVNENEASVQTISNVKLSDGFRNTIGTVVDLAMGMRGLGDSTIGKIEQLGSLPQRMRLVKENGYWFLFP